ncbi:MAG TPA: TfoX/Sxy family protein [Devosiaceae bacterium]|nr:TfoX/Sxy family protein [Devosiaceae bacterium]
MSATDELTARIRSHVSMDPRVTEQRMFGGICFLLNGRILVAARRSGTLLVQCGAENAALATAEPGVTHMMMRGKPTPNFVDVEDGLVETDEGLTRWIDLAERYVGSLPPKEK